MHEGTWLMLDALMFVGGGSASTAGGIKVTTLAVLFLAAFAEAELNGAPARDPRGHPLALVLVGRVGDDHRDLDPAHRRDGLGLTLVFDDEVPRDYTVTIQVGLVEGVADAVTFIAALVLRSPFGSAESTSCC